MEETKQGFREEVLEEQELVDPSVKELGNNEGEEDEDDE